MRREYGDFQTPPGLVSAVLGRLGPIAARWPRVFEPTCGRGHFLAGLLALDPPPREVLGVEVQSGHLEAARAVANTAPQHVRVGLTAGSFFDLDLKSLAWADPAGPLLVVGNPPWITSAELGTLGSTNRPRRSNPKSIRGIDALTGASNFDAAEAVWLKLLTELADQSPTVALLCKTAVARNVLEHTRRLGLPIALAEVVRIDARAWFSASVDACLLRITLGVAQTPTLDRIPVFSDLNARVPESAMGFARARLVVDFAAYSRVSTIDGASPIEWRQGLKHDASAVMELTGERRNGLGGTVEVEDEHVYPLLKGSDLARPRPIAPRRAVLVTQRAIGEDTRPLERDAPRLWAYLQRHDGAFDRRKSSVYRGRPPYSMFGVGPYAFAPYKVAVSGLHKHAVFHAVGPVDRRPVMCDDTSYYLSCRSAEQAALIEALLNQPMPIDLLRSFTTPGAKRSVTKAALQRLDLGALLTRSDSRFLRETAGNTVVRLTGAPARWPDRLHELLEP